MREIKYRMWDGNKKEMVDNAASMAILVGGTPVDQETGTQINFMQYTGLKDKNGKEIYEGDILKTLEGKGAIGVVIFAEGMFISRHPESGLICHLSGRCWSVSSDWECLRKPRAANHPTPGEERMKLSEVIETLKEIEEMHGGDVVVFVNGEHGESEPELAKEDHFAVGEAYLTLGFPKDKLPFGIRERDTAMQIGGY